MQKPVQSFQELRIYRLAFQNSIDLYALVEHLADDSATELACRLLAISRAVRAHIAAAWGKRRDRLALLGQLSEAHFQTTEIQIWLEVAIQAGYLDADAGQSLGDRYRYLATALDQLMETVSIGRDRWDKDLPATA
ncbi:MAG: four helix bundle protein [Leptolyngbya sp. SIO4C5]|nr:four helix bundle protein [Leptolyngbya sp. SIO4C5]